MAERRVIDVVSVTDRRYAPLVGVVAFSIARHLGSATSVRYHVLYEGAGGEPTPTAMPEGIELVRHPVTGVFAALERGGHVSVATYLRLLIPEALAHIDRVIYLDLDLVVLDDLTALFDADIGEAPYAGVLDFPLYNQLAREGQQSWRHHHTRRYLGRLGLDPRKLRYVNAGVALMQLGRLREIDFSRRATEVALRRGDKLRWLDQDVVNLLLREEIAVLDRRWNSIVGTKDVDLGDPSQRPSIVHFASPDKPWLPQAKATDRDLWSDYASRAGVRATDILPAPPFLERPQRTLLQRLLGIRTT